MNIEMGRNYLLNSALQENERAMKVYRDNSKMFGFTLIEIIVVIVIMAIAAMLAIPMLGSSGTAKVRSAAGMISADIEYAKSMAVTKQVKCKVVFDESAESYRIEIEDANGTIIQLQHPVNTGSQYVISFKNDSRVSGVDIVSADFGGAKEVEFNKLGVPGNGVTALTSEGSVTLSGGGVTKTVNVEPVTGFVSIK